MSSTAAAASALPPIGLGTVVAVADDHVGVQVDSVGALRAEVAVHARVRPRDRVVLAFAEGGRGFIIGVLQPDEPPGEFGDESTSEAEVPVNRERWTVPEGDIELFAERGRVVIRARDGVAIESEGDVSALAGGCVSLESDEGRSGLRLDSDVAELKGGLLAMKAARLRVLAEEIETFANRAETQIEQARSRFDELEIDAGRIAQTAHTMLTRVEDLAQTQAGRIRLTSKGALSAIAERARLVARDVFHIDGDRIHLG